MNVLCHRCAFQALDGPEYTSPAAADVKYDVPTQPVIVYLGRSWCMEHLLETVMDSLGGGEA